MQWHDTHLSYCLNIHPAETLDEVTRAVEKHATRIKARVRPDAPFGLALRLSARAARELENSTPELRRRLDDLGMYVFTINGFPYGPFHGEMVKRKVYQPDWTHPDRLEYTHRLIDILSRLLPEGVDGTMSTLPIAYGKEIPGEAIANLLEAARRCAAARRESGHAIVLTLEPEPDCALSLPHEVLSFWDRLRGKAEPGILDHLGLCLDTCHLACEFEDPARTLEQIEEAGIPVPKIHLSAAPIAPAGIDPEPVLGAYAEEIYLHQTRVRSAEEVKRYSDLPEALRENPGGEWRVHFHVPLHFQGNERLETTARLLKGAFFRRAVTPGRHLVVETYTFEVLPEKDEGVVSSVTKELEWVMDGFSTE